MTAVGFTANISIAEHNLVASYFAKYMLMNPYIVQPTTVTQVFPATFEKLLEAVSKTIATQVVIVTHGFTDGSGLYLPLVAGKGHVTHDQLDKLMIVANKTPPVATGADAQSLGLTRAEFQGLVDLTNILKKKKPPLDLIEFRGCYLGKNYQSLTRFRQFFGANKMGAPKIGGYFVLFPHKHGTGILATHTKSHVGTTHTYPESFSAPAGKCLCCIGVDTNDEPENGHLVADTQDALNRWVSNKFLSGASLPTGNIPLHFLFDKSPPLPPLPPGVLATAVPKPKPEPYYPLSVEYAAQIRYSP
jgi:hypothetical protein